MTHNYLTGIDYDWEQLKNHFQRLEWMAEGRGLTVDELVPFNYPWEEYAHFPAFPDQQVIARLRALVFESYTS